MKRAIGLMAVAGLCLLGCAHTPQQPGARSDLKNAAAKTLAEMEAKDPSLKDVVDKSAGYIVFPAVGQAGFLVGGGGGNGVLFENGQFTHFAELRHLDAGALAGGQRYSELVVVKDPKTLQALRDGRYDFGANASAVIVRSGVATGASFGKDTSVFILPIRGAMVNASVTGQRIRLTL